MDFRLAKEEEQKKQEFERRAKAYGYILGDTDYHQNKIADALGL